MAGPLDLLLQSSAQLFADACTPELQERVENGEWPVELWRSIDDNGLLLALVPEDQGGIGLSWVEAAAVLRLAGAFAVPAPLAESMLAARLLAEAGLDPGAAKSKPTSAGEPPRSTLTLAPTRLSDAFSIEADTAEGFVVTGRASRVPWATSASVVVMASGPGGSVHVARFCPGNEDLRMRKSASGEPVADLAVDGRALSESDVAGLPAALSRGTLLARLALARSAQMAGAMDRIFDLTLEHARERQQFGRPIARFQAVQQLISELAAEVAAVGAAVEAAAVAVDRSETSPAARLAVAAAKSRASEATSKVTAIAHQVHGAIGFTREHVLHRFTRRLWTWRDDAGTERDWQEKIGRQVAAAGAEGLWDLICEEPACQKT